MFDTQVTVVGNLVADPRLYLTSSGHPVTSFRVASTPRRFDRSSNEWRDGETLYASVTCWRGLAENVAASLKKGQSAIVIGRLSVRPYQTKEGEKRQSVDIDAVAVGPDLARVITVVKRAERGAVLAPVPGLVADQVGVPAAGEHDWSAESDLEPEAEPVLAAEPAEGTGDDVRESAASESAELVGALVAGDARGRMKGRFGIG
jgi:single-strand DNA-binding protein